jgi:hypothetical protein
VLLASIARVALRLACLLALASCAIADPPASDNEPSDYDPVDWSGDKADATGLPATFDRNTILSETVFWAPNAVTGNAVQAFLEDSPYGTRSWLADATVGGVRFSDAVVAIAQQSAIDPVVLLARAQVESSLVSATRRPSSVRIATALGCGCPDAGGCTDSDEGLGQQLRCGALTMAARDVDSQDGTGEWVAHEPRTTSDHYRVLPANHATAAMYAYTPWVLPGRGGNWLVWNVTRKFLKHFDDAGTLKLP